MDRADNPILPLTKAEKLPVSTPIILAILLRLTPVPAPNVRVRSAIFTKEAVLRHKRYRYKLHSPSARARCSYYIARLA